MWWHDTSGGDWLWMTLMMAAFWGIVVWAIIMLARQARTAPAPGTDAEEILRARYARGEIDEGELEERLAVLRGRRSAKT
jgi:putative membrane protein